MPDERYEHQAIVQTPDGKRHQLVHPTDYPAAVGQRTRDYCSDDGSPGETVEIQRRPVGEWETVERREVPAKGGDS